MAPMGMKRAATQRVKPDPIGRVKHLRGEEVLRHASLRNFREGGTYRPMGIVSTRGVDFLRADIVSPLPRAIADQLAIPNAADRRYMAAA
jgi:hypothetical protein